MFVNRTRCLRCEPHSAPYINSSIVGILTGANNPVTQVGNVKALSMYYGVSLQKGP